MEAWTEARARELIAGARERPGATLLMLQALNDAFGHLPDAAVPLVAEALNLTRAEVHGVLTFYHDLRRRPPGRHVVKLCRAEACQAVGARELEAALTTQLGIGLGETTADGQVTLEPVYCLGNCAAGPSALVDGRLCAQADIAAIEAARDARPELLPRVAGGPRIFVPGEATAVALGADEVARAIAAEAARLGIAVGIVRTGSRGAAFLEPLIEIETAEGRVGYGPISAEDVPSLFAAGFLSDGAHAKRIGKIDTHPWFAGQERLTFARCGVVDPRSLDDCRAAGGLAGLTRARTMAPADIVAEIEASGLRGRGGAGFPAGRKWRTVLETAGAQKYIVCNADEGDSGTFADRLLMEGDPFLLIEGMMIAGLATGARQGIVYLRSEYPDAARTFAAALDAARAGGLLGDGFDIELRLGAGAYICGEETSLLESLEGKRGTVRPKPPVPAIAGLWGKPTLVHNVLSLAAVPAILERGAGFYRDFGAGRSRGTMPVQLAGNVRYGGLYEVAFGITLRRLVMEIGGGTRSGRPVRAVQVGGPLGAYFPAAMLDLPFDYEALAEAGGLLGHGGIVVFDDTVDMAAQARFAFEFCAIESCGKCTPCRIGSTRGVEVIDRILAGIEREKNLALVEDLCTTLRDGSLCALGGLTPLPVESALRHFPEDFAR
ncbi:NAD(P)H-dependent oxidoreductase subunit E [Desertibaculum subflavum]|uniref:NAD(P)H-dependent oxidoreductase subunit E n=1 Tax=Desertibaculum subflavum TaxID=2268458 RepID=UPI000E676338